jgi:hypothetical protein
MSDDRMTGRVLELCRIFEESGVFLYMDLFWGPGILGIVSAINLNGNKPDTHTTSIARTGSSVFRLYQFPMFPWYKLHHEPNVSVHVVGIPLWPVWCIAVMAVAYMLK